jgi:predicted cupin superfamily sugar epimerase
LVYFYQGGRTAIKLLMVDGKLTNRTHLNMGGIIEDALLAGAIVPANIFGAPV